MVETSNKSDDIAPTSGVANSSTDTDKNVARAHNDSRNDDEGEDGRAYEQPPLPFSKARCIALVATLTGASFLNASLAPRSYHSSSNPVLTPFTRLYHFSLSSLFYLPSVTLSQYLSPVSSG